MTRKDDQGDQPSGGQTTWTNTGARRSGRGLHKTGELGDGKLRPVPARYVRQSQMCPQLDMSDKNEKKTQDMSDKARCVRQKLQKIARYVRQMSQTKMKTKCKICLTGHNYNL